MSIQNKEEESCFPNLLSQRPIGDDKFSGKAQENVSLAIEKTIRNGSHKIIGIDGSWGTGKSNLVEITRKNMTDYIFFIYDAWEHQEDYQRRSIIEELVNFLSDEKTGPKNIAIEDIINEKDKILGSVVKRKTMSIPKFNLQAVLIIFALIFIPFANYSSNQDEWNASIKLFLSSMPIMLFIISIIITMISSFNSKNKFWDEFCGKFICFFKDKELESSTVEYTNLENPSTVAFRKFIHKINTKLVKSKNLVIVIDNIDRLPNRKVKELWSSIRVFFPENYDKAKFNDKLTVIVPFDRRHIKKAFKGQSDCDDLINKTFNVIYRVSLPVLNDWESFFEENWKNAFGTFNCEENTRSEFDRVKHIYDTLTDIITPRGIISFINECVILKSINCNEKIKYRYIAIFAKCKTNILKNPVKNIIEREYLNKIKLFYENDSDLDKSIAALTFQVPLEKSLEIAFSRSLKNALENNDTAMVKEIAKSTTFGSLLRGLIYEITNVPNAILAISEIDQKYFGGSEVIENTWTALYGKVCDFDERTAGSKLKIEPYHKVLLKHIKDDEKIDYAIKFITENLSTSSGVLVNKFIGILTVLNNILEKFQINIFEKLSHKDIDGIDGVLETATINSLGNIKFIPTLLKTNAKIPLYCQHLTKGFKSSYQNYSEFIILVERLKEVSKPIMLDDFTSKNFNDVSQKVKAGDTFYYDLLAIGLAKFSFIDISNAIFNTLVCKKESMMAQDMINNMSKDMSDEMIYNIGIAESNTLLADENNTMQLAKRIGFYINYGDLLLRFDNLSDFELYKKLCRYITEHDEYEHKADIIKLVPQLQNICVICELDIDEVTKVLDENTLDSSRIQNIKDIITIDFLNFTKEITDIRFIDVCRKKIDEYLFKFNKDSWAKFINYNLSTYEVKAAMLVNFQWNRPALEAVKEFLASKALEKNINLNLKKWAEFLKNVEKSGNNLSYIFIDVMNISSTKSLSKAQFLFWGEFFFKYALAEQQINKETLNKLLPAGLLNDDHCLDIIIENSATVLKIYEAAEEEGLEFKNKLIVAAKQGNKKCKKLVDILNI